MNDRRDPLDQVDTALSAEYRSIADETTPPALDQTVLAHASDTGNANRTPREFWYRPVALAATIVLSVLFIIQATDSNLFHPQISTVDPALDDRVTPEPAEPFQDAANVTLDQLRQANEQANAAMKSIAPPQSGNTTQDQSVSLLPVTDRCSDADRSAMSSWWKCIQNLEKHGLTQSAEREIQALMAAHPSSVRPR